MTFHVAWTTETHSFTASPKVSWAGCSLSRMRLHVWCRALDGTTTSSQCYRSCSGIRFDVGWFQDGHPGLPVTVRHGSSLSGRRLPVGLRRRWSSAAFCHIKDVRCETNLQQLWRQVFCSCRSEAVEQPSNWTATSWH